MEFHLMTTGERVAAVRSLWEKGLTRGQIAERLGTTSGVVSGIKHRASMKLGQTARNRARWATPERVEAMRKAAPAAMEWWQLWQVAKCIDGPPMAGPRRVADWCRSEGFRLGAKRKHSVEIARQKREERRADIEREKRRAIDAKLRHAAAAEATREWAARVMEAAAPSTHAEPRGTPGVMLPPVGLAWEAIQAKAQMQGQIIATRDDLLIYNRWRVREGYPPLAIAGAFARR